MSYVYDESERRCDRDLVSGTRVQREDANGFVGGLIGTVDPPQMPRTNEYWRGSKEQKIAMTAHAHVHWDDGKVDILPLDTLELEDSEIERSFRVAASTAGKLINEKLAIAAKAVEEAEEIADKYGVPFSSGVSPLGQSYYPSTIDELYPDLDKDFVDSFTGAYHSEYGDSGWQHSSVC